MGIKQFSLSGSFSPSGPNSVLKSVHDSTLILLSVSVTVSLSRLGCPFFLSLYLSPYLSSSLSVSLCLSLLLSVEHLGLVLTNWSSSWSLPGACTTPQTRVETGASCSQSKAWKNEGRRRRWGGCTGWGWGWSLNVFLCLCFHSCPLTQSLGLGISCICGSFLLLRFHFYFPTFHIVEYV